MDKTNLFNLFEPELRENETIVWADTPSPAARIRSQIKIPFMGIAFTAFSVLWLNVTADDREPLFQLFGIPFLCIGLCALLSPVYFYHEAKKWLYYAITNQRIIIKRTFPRRKTETFGPSDITKLERTTNADGSGNLIFAEEIRTGRKKSTYTVPRGFYGINDVKRVEHALQELKSNSGT